MHPTPLPLTHGALLLDNSALEKYTTCKRSFEYNTINKRTLANNKSALIYGGAVHKALELRSHGRIIDDQLAALHAYFEVNPFEVNDSEWRSPQIAADLVRLYNREYSIEPYDILSYTAKDGLPIKAIEVPFMHFLTDIYIPSITRDVIPVYYTGRIDLVVVDHNKSIYIMDHKTTSMTGARFFDEFALSSQMLGYCWAVQQSIQKPVNGYIVDALCSRKPTRTGVPFELTRQQFYTDQDAINEWRTNLGYLITDIVRDHERSYYPMETKWCVGKYGRCPYFDVCTVPQSGRAALLQSNLFTDSTWSPLNH